MKGWPKYRTRVLSEAEQANQRQYFNRRGNSIGVAIILGHCARYVVFDFDTEGAHEAWLAMLPADLREQVASLYPVVRSPKGHVGHVYVPLAAADLSEDGWFHEKVIAAKTPSVLARKVVLDDEGQETTTVSIELRLPRKHAIMAPGSGYGVHDKHPERTWVYAESGPGRPRIEDLEDLPPISEADYFRLVEAATELDDPRVQEVDEAQGWRRALAFTKAKSIEGLPEQDRQAMLVALGPPKGSPASDRPGDDFNERGTWEEILTPLGWESLGDDLWRRPGGSGTTASTKFGALFVFSTNAWPLEASGGERQAYSKFSAIAELHHGGDFKAAARELGRQGYGRKGRKRRRSDSVQGDQEVGSMADDFGRSRPRLLLMEGDLPLDLDTAEGIVAKAEVDRGRDRLLFVRGGQLVHRVPGELGGSAFMAVKSDALREHFGREALFQKDGKDGIEPCDLPSGHAKAYLARDAYAFPRLAAVAHTPLIRPSGKVCTVPGFDPESGVWLNLEPGVWSGFDGSVPCKAKAEAALGVLHVPLEEFSWKEPVDRSVALSAILTVLGRNLFDCAPLFVIAANTRGTGKSLLAEVITLIGTGTRASMLQLAAEEELNKAVHSLLMEAASVICIDNIDRPLNSAALCTALTQAVFTRRVLGVSRTSSPPTTGTTWLATGNNLTIEGDLTRRSLYCELDAGMERPEERRFSRDLIPWVREHRVELVQAGLTVLSAFLGRSDDEQVPSLSPFGGFDGWSRIVRGALMWLGEPDPCLTRDRTIDDDPEREDLHRLLRALVGVFGEARFQAKDLPGSGRGAGELATVLLEILGKDDCSNSRKLGKLLSKYKGRWVDGLRIAPAGKKQGVAVWMIERAPERADDERREETSWVS